MQDKQSKILIVIAALIVGVLMPYLSRIPLALTHGAGWIWKYMRTSDDFVRWNGFHLFSLIPIVIFGLVYVFGNARWAFYASVCGHYAVTSLIYYSHGEPPFPDDYVGCVLFPFPIAGASLLCGLIALAAELIAVRLKA